MYVAEHSGANHFAHSFTGSLHELAPTAWEAAGLGVVRPCSGGVTAVTPRRH